MKKYLKIVLAGAIAVIIATATAVFILNDTAQVVIDAGHGGHDVGAEYNGRYEKNDNLAVAFLVAEKLEEKGIDVELTRDDDTFISLENRCKIANSKKAQLFVSLHRNSAANAKGVEIWVSSDKPENDTMLAENILNNLDEAGISQNRGVKYGYARGDGNYFVNSHTDMPSCLVELGFMNSEEDNALYDQNIDSYAQAIADAIESSLAEQNVIDK